MQVVGLNADVSHVCFLVGISNAVDAHHCIVGFAEILIRDSHTKRIAVDVEERQTVLHFCVLDNRETQRNGIVYRQSLAVGCLESGE